MGLEGIAKVAIAVYKVGFEESDVPQGDISVCTYGPCGGILLGFGRNSPSRLYVLLHGSSLWYNIVKGKGLSFGPVDKYGYVKNHKKTVKNGQARTRETEEHKRSQRFKAKAKKSQLPAIYGSIK
ncbi:hypothetical protein Tco_1503341 [Tanacetum coccineum]